MRLYGSKLPLPKSNPCITNDIVKPTSYWDYTEHVLPYDTIFNEIQNTIPTDLPFLNIHNDAISLVTHVMNSKHTTDVLRADT